MKDKTKVDRFKHSISHINHAYTSLTNDPDLGLFLFENKPGVDLCFPTKCEKHILELIKMVAEGILKRKIYFGKYNLNGTKGLLLLKKPLKNKIKSIKELGKILGIPNCCIKKYIEEDDGRGYSRNSAKRYIKQFEKLGRKTDPFDISISATHAETGIGLIPCNPRCEDALKIVNNFEKIKKRLKLK